MKLEKIIKLEYGKGLPAKKRKIGEFPVVGSNGIVGYHNQALVKGPNIVLGRKGTIGSVTLINKDFWPIDTTYYLRFLTEDIDIKWIYYALKKLNLSKLRLSDVVPGLKRDLVYLQKIQIPPLTEQNKIAEILSTVDQAIEKTDKAIEQTKHLKKSMMDILLEPKFKDSKSGKNETNKLIKEWQHEYLGNLAKLERGKFTHRPRNDPKFYGGQFPFIQTGDITESAEIIKKYSQTLNDEGIKISKLFKKGTLVISIAGNIGEVGILGFDAYFPDSIVGIIPYEKIINGYFLLYVLEKLQKYIDASAPRSTQKNINLEILKRLKILFPSLKKQKRIVDYLNGFGQKIKLLQIKEEKLTSIKKGLMNDLLTGKKRVRLES